MTGMNDYLNAVMSLQLPFALIPTIAFTSSKAIMGEFTNGVVTIISSLLLAAVVIGINTYYVVDLVTIKFSGEWPALLAVFIFGLFYFMLCLYLFLHMLASIGICRSFTTNSVSIYYINVLPSCVLKWKYSILIAFDSILFSVCREVYQLFCYI